MPFNFYRNLIIPLRGYQIHPRGVIALVANLSFPVIIVNFKTYLESQGKKALELSKAAEKVARENGVCIAVAPQSVDIRLIATTVDIPILAQHIDPEAPGAQTGHLAPEAAKEAGAIGSLLNHSECRLRADIIEETVRRATALGLRTCICANTPAIGAAVSAFSPTMVAVEPPELIGSGISVSKAKPEVVRDSVLAIKKIDSRVRVLCGAGVTSGDDVEVAIKLGSEGILVASGVVKAKDPSAVLTDFAKNIKGRK
jgi:triosephosphate isomerase